MNGEKEEMDSLFLRLVQFFGNLCQGINFSTFFLPRATFFWESRHRRKNVLRWIKKIGQKKCNYLRTVDIEKRNEHRLE